jgi:hypothetical protein
MSKLFLKWMPGVYNNKPQAFAKPFEFPMVRFNIELLPLKIDNKPCFRIEQYKIAQGDEPYRIGYFTAKSLSSESVSIQNYQSVDFSTNKFCPYSGATLEVIFDRQRNEFCSALSSFSITKGEKLVLVQSQIILRENGLAVLDRGYDSSTDKLLWGFNYGPVLLQKETI